MSNLSIVIQGNLRPETPAAIRSARECFPADEIIFSTWRGQAPIPEYDLCNALLELEDPGPIAGANVSLRNLLRQTSSTRAGIVHARGEWVLKSRSDLILQDGKMLRAFPETLGDRVAVWRYFTGDAAVISALFHVSDLLQIGARSRMLEYWPASLAEDVSASGLLPEQWLFLHFLHVNGEIDHIDRSWLKTGFSQLHMYQRALAKYVRIIPAEAALLPERLRTEAPGFLDRESDGSLQESLSIYAKSKYRELTGLLRKLKRRILRIA
jgi:hypothetical protein